MYKQLCNQDPTLRVLLGTELKIAVGSPDVNLAACDFTLEVFTHGDKRVSLAKADCRPIPGTQQFMAVIDSGELGVGGPVNVVLTAHVPDTDCPDGVRTEVMRCQVEGVAQIASPWA